MYLANLSKEQKELFLDLSILSMESKGVVDEREKTLLKQYCGEMEIAYRSEKKINSYETVMDRLKEVSSFEELKKITVEILALIYIDEKFEEEENELLICLRKKFEFSAHLLEELIFATRHLLLSYRILEKIVN